MEYDEDKVNEMMLVLLYLTLGDDRRAWKELDWNAMDRLCDEGMIADPQNRNKPAALTEQGAAS